MAPLQALFQSVNEVPYLVHPQAIVRLDSIQTTQVIVPQLTLARER